MTFPELSERIEGVAGRPVGETAGWQQHVNHVGDGLCLGGWIGPGAKADPAAFIHPTAAVFGEGTSIGPGTTLGERVLIGPHVITRGDTTIEHGAWVTGESPRLGPNSWPVQIEDSYIAAARVIASHVLQSNITDGVLVQESWLASAELSGPGTTVIASRIEGGEVGGGAWLVGCRVGQEARIDAPVILQNETIADQRYARDPFPPAEGAEEEEADPFRRAEDVGREAGHGPRPNPGRWIN